MKVSQVLSRDSSDVTVRPEARSRLAADLAGPVLAAGQRRHPPRVDVEADGAGKMLGKADRNRQADIAQPNHRDFTHDAPDTVKIGASLKAGD